MKNISPEKLEELMKEFDNYETETLEQTAEKYANEWEEIYPELDPENMTPIEISKIDFIAGAKWQMDKQDEFAIEFGEWLMKKGRYNITNWSKTTEELLETYKNTLPR